MSGTLVEEIHSLGDDTLLVAEITSNRPDLLGILGIAREVSALTGAPLRIPEADFAIGEEKVASASSVEVRDPALCPRYTARLIREIRGETMNPLSNLPVHQFHGLGGAGGEVVRHSH